MLKVSLFFDPNTQFGFQDGDFTRGATEEYYTIGDEVGRGFFGFCVVETLTTLLSNDAARQGRLRHSVQVHSKERRLDLVRVDFKNSKEFLNRVSSFLSIGR